MLHDEQRENHCMVRHLRHDQSLLLFLHGYSHFCPFLVFDELQTGVGFMDKNIWFSLLLFLGLGILWNVVGIFVALRNAAGVDNTNQRSERTALGPLGISLWAVLSGKFSDLSYKNL